MKKRKKYWYIVVGWSKGGEYKRAPMGLGDWFGVKGGKLTFHVALYTQIFKSKRAAQRAIDRSKAWDCKDSSGGEYSITRYAIDRLTNI